MIQRVSCSQLGNRARKRSSRNEMIKIVEIEIRLMKDTKNDTKVKVKICQRKLS